MMEMGLGFQFRCKECGKEVCLMSEFKKIEEHLQFHAHVESELKAILSGGA